ncbi:chitinase [Andreprevotia lacus DSM 23236]|uniref:chitinase n=1 Tax=Andreprevotia lacus DSM 23236 TaxID=1121001 RepID=A0A1W1XXD1_9NEIS|nr:carbohydrate-binding protein [Andreprevotia lacus]SMC28640.1 chitinase [Andreprevotia lacus DSM 23236]
MQHTKHRASLMTRVLAAVVMAGGIMAAHAAPAWQEGTTYTVGTVVTYNGHDYQALVAHTAYVGAGWTPSSTPTLWKDLGVTTGTTPTATPTSTPVPTVTPTTPVTSIPLPTVTPTTVTGGCTAAAWSSSTAYNGGAQVSYNGRNYTAKWWTQGNVPSSSTGDGQPWNDAGPCAGGPTATPKPTVTPTPEIPPVTPTPTIKPTVTPIPSVTPTPTNKPTVTPTPTATPTPVVTPTPTTVPPTTVPGTGTLPKHALVGYWHNFTNPAGDTFPVSQISDDWDVIVIAFADNAGNGNVAFNLDSHAGSEAQFIADVAAKKAKGKKVVLSLGGQDGSITLNTASDVTNFVNSLYGILTKYGFDGIDLDLESGSGVSSGAPIINNLITGVKQLKAKIGPSFYLSMAPEHPYVQGGYISYGSIWGAYLPIIDGLRDDLSILHVQYYNNGGFTYTNGAMVNEGTVDALVGGSLMLIEGFKVNYGTGWEFKGLRPDQVAFGVPSGSQSAGRGFVTAQVVSDSLNCLTKLQGCGSIKPAKAYPDYRGVMTWSINWDKHDGYNFSKPAAAALKTLP